MQVVKRVAGGELTPFVDIRSDKDILGSSLYHMVQNNDLLLARIRTIATCVHEQAATMEDISNHVTKIHDLAGQNTEQLIHNTTTKSGYGVTMATEASKAFYRVENMLSETVFVMERISAATARQGEAISEVRSSIEVIAEVGHSLADFSLNTSSTRGFLKTPNSWLFRRKRHLLR